MHHLPTPVRDRAEVLADKTVVVDIAVHQLRSAREEMKIVLASLVTTVGTIDPRSSRGGDVRCVSFLGASSLPTRCTQTRFTRVLSLPWGAVGVLRYLAHHLDSFQGVESAREKREGEDARAHQRRHLEEHRGRDPQSRRDEIRYLYILIHL